MLKAVKFNRYVTLLQSIFGVPRVRSATHFQVAMARLTRVTPLSPDAAALSRRPLLGHDHAQCIRSALAQADAVCETNGTRLTPLRRRVLELIWVSHKPLGAYELLDQLTQEGHKPAPPTIYRALDFLLENRLIHRLASLNAFLGCSHPGDAHAGYFLICQHCGNTEEITHNPALQSALNVSTEAAGFTVLQSALELSGICHHCQAKSS